MPPPGGPRDTVAPRIVQTVPNDGTVRWNQPVVQIVFSEDMATVDPRSLVTIFPPDPFVAQWLEEDRLEIRLDSLRQRQTYVIVLSPGFRDLEGNPLEGTVTVVFSTGDSLNRNAAIGKIFGTIPQGQVWVLLTKEGTKWQDSAWYYAPDYQMEVGRDREFRFPALQSARYRIAAFVDRNGNRRYDPEREAYAVGWREVDLRSRTVDTVNLWLSPPPDYVAPKLLNVTPLSSQRLRLQFSEPLDMQSVFPEYVQCRDTTTGELVKPLGIGLEAGKVATLVAVFPHPLSDGVWEIQIQNVRDTSGNQIDSAYAHSFFRPISKPDTVTPRLAAMPLERDSAMLLQPFFRWVLQFTAPMDTGTTFRAIQCFQMGDAVQEIDLKKRWKGVTYCEISPLDSLGSARWYELSIDTTAKDVLGRALHRSYRFRFQSPDLREMGEVTGEIVDVQYGGPYIVVAQGVGYGIHYRRRVANGQKWGIAQVVPDRYRIWVFEDRNRNGRFDYGSMNPYQPSERFTVWEEVVKIAPRWSTEGIIFRMPQFPAASRSE